MNKTESSLICEKSPARDRAGALSLIRDKFRDVFQVALEDGAELAQGFGFYVVIGFQSADGFAVDAALLPQHISRELLLLHSDPQTVEFDHKNPPCILIRYIMGAIILNYKGI